MSKRQLKKLKRTTELTKGQLDMSKPKYPLKETEETVQMKTEWGKYKGKKKRGSKTLHKVVSDLA